jgi:hypothetical protein
MRIRRRIVLGIAALCGSLLPVGAAGCSSFDNTSYGPPGGLTGKKLPGQSDTADAGPSEGGMDDAAGAGDGGAPASDCGVSWSTQIFPQMTASGSWKCSDMSSCHGGLQSPLMTADPSVTYAHLAAYTMHLGPQRLPYLLPGEPDPSKSGIECNLTSDACGNRMPLTSNGARLLDAQQSQVLDAWVRCGSPDN